MFDRVLNTLVTLYCDKNLEKQEFICNKVVDPSATLLKIELLFTYISKFLEHKCTCCFCQRTIRKGMETGTKPTIYSHFLGLGFTAMFLIKRVITA